MAATTQQIKDLENEIDELSARLEIKRNELQRLRESNGQSAPANSLSNSEISRFSRQIILPEIGVKGQIKLKNTKVLIIGAGGLGKYRNYQQPANKNQSTNLSDSIIQVVHRHCIYVVLELVTSESSTTTLLS